MRTSNATIYWDTLDSRTGYGPPVPYANLSISAAATAYGRPVNLNGVWTYNVQVVLAGATTPVATLKLQGSNDSLEDPNGNVIRSGVEGIPLASTMVWTDVAGSSVAVAANGNWVWNASDVGYEWVRVVYTYSSGSGGTLTGRIKCKGPE
jgi:hypothetical protein